MATTKPTLVILIHGTRGRKSTWAVPCSSNSVLATQLRKKCPDGSLEIDRFEWSGKNSGSARTEAVEKLKWRLTDDLNKYERIMLVAHSHGGNIAIRACHKLEKAEQKKVMCITMGTPFLKLERRLNFFDLFESISPLSKRYLGLACLVTFIFFCWSAVMQLDQDFALFESNGLVEKGISFMFLFGPIVLGLLFRSLLKTVTKRVKRSLDENRLQGYGSTQDESTVHSITYTQDEVYQGLSLILFFFSLVHQALFLVVFWLRKVQKINLFGRSWNIVRSILRVALLLILLVFVVLINEILDDVLSISSEVSNGMAGILLTANFVVVVVGVVCIGVIVSLLIFGGLRLCLLWAIGSVDEIYVRDQMLTRLLSTYSISAIPAGHARTYLLEGGALFNHTQIYNDQRVVRYIGDLLT